MHDPRTDHDLLRSARRGDEAFAVLYRRRVLAVHTALVRRAGADLADDLTAETFARAWLHRRRFRDDHAGSALPWLLGIAANLVRESARRRRVETAARARLGMAVPTAPAELADQIVARLDAAARAPRLLAALSPAERAAVELRVGQDLSFEQVAIALGVRPAAARLRVSRALRRLSRNEEASRE